ncbi:hypothetical protein COOONC_24104, partial [Cooperia oncophora]
LHVFLFYVAISPFRFKALKCLLVIPASNADPERSFSTVNRLTRTDRNNLGTPMIGCSNEPKNLVRQWMTPLPGLDLRPHMPSTFVRSDSFMKDVKDAMLKGDTDALLDLYVTHYMTKNRLNDRHDAQKIMKVRDGSSKLPEQ